MSSKQVQATMEVFYGHATNSTGNAAPHPSSGGNKPKTTHPILAYLQNLAGKLPKVACGGMPCIPEEGARGAQAKSTSEALETEEDILWCLEDAKFPNFPVHFATDPKKRAVTHRQGMLWTHDDMMKARDEFVVPSELKTVFICPEISDRDLLQKHQKYQTPTGGVMSQCLHCKTNEHMQQMGWTSMRSSTPRSLNKEMTHDVIIGATYGCYNPSCSTINPYTKQKSPKTFTAYQGDFWKQYPEEVRT